MERSLASRCQAIHAEMSGACSMSEFQQKCIIKADIPFQMEEEEVP